MKSPIQRRVAIAALLLAPLLTACGFSEQTDQVYQAGVGANDRSGTVDILNAVIVSGTDGSGTFAGTLVNKDQSKDDRLDSVSGDGITSGRTTVDIPAAGTALLADKGEVTVQGNDIVPGNVVQLTFSFESGQTTTMGVPVVDATGDYSSVPLPSPSSSRTPSRGGSKSSSSSSSSSPSSSPTASSTP